MKYVKRSEQIDLFLYLGKWLLLACTIAALAGSASAFFLFALDWATNTRVAHRWLTTADVIPGFQPSYFAASATF